VRRIAYLKSELHEGGGRLKFACARWLQGREVQGVPLKEIRGGGIEEAYNDPKN